jgi:hypothetical protein
VTGLIDAIRSHVLALPDLAKFAVAVPVLMLVTSILGPLLTERFAPGMLEGAARDTRQTRA